MRLRLDFAVAAVILMPFLTVGFDFRTSLIFQAVGIFAIVLASLPRLLTPEGQEMVTGSPRLVRVGILMMSLATIIGVVVGLIQGHDLSHIVGQALSMGLLPMAAVGGLATWPPPVEERWKTGLLVALVLGCWIQLAWGFVMIVLLGEPSRLFLPNSVSVIGPALFGLCFSLICLGDRDRRMRILAWIATGSILAVILGSSLRSLWILTPLTIVAVVVVSKGLRSRQAAIAAVAVVLIGSATAGAVWRINSWVESDFPDGLETSPCSLFPRAGKCVDGNLEYLPTSARRIRFEAPISLSNGEAWRVMVRGQGEGNGAMVVALLFFDDHGREVGRIPVPIRAGEESGVGRAVGTVSPGWTEARLRLSRWQGSTGRWLLEDVEISVLESPTKVRFAAKALAVKERAWGLARVVKTGRADGDATLGFRWHEGLTIVEALSQGSWVDRLFGRGLGATLHLNIDGFDNRGHWVHYDDVNYIHNWYLFLLYKLGIVGTLLVLGAVGGWIAFTIQMSVRTVDVRAKTFLAAAAVVWLVYCVWSLTSPEILDFRMAPLWGWLLSVSVNRARREEIGECL